MGALRWILAILGVLAIVGVSALLPPRPVYLSDLKVEVVRYYWANPQRNASVDGNSLIIGEKWYEKGYGVHAETELKVLVPPGYTHFVSIIGVDDEIKDDLPASVQFQLVGDGVILFESPVIRAADAPRRIVVDVSDVEELHLIAKDGGDGPNSDHADWANARFIKR
ncbi:MAG: hypothetical protein GC154_18065 [bacterium]|nr:hypothetical protein [bacterium]